MLALTCCEGSGSTRGTSSSWIGTGALTFSSTTLAPFFGSAFVGAGAFLVPFAYAYSSISFLRTRSRFS